MISGRTRWYLVPVLVLITMYEVCTERYLCGRSDYVVKHSPSIDIKQGHSSYLTK